MNWLQHDAFISQFRDQFLFENGKNRAQLQYNRIRMSSKYKKGRLNVKGRETVLESSRIHKNLSWKMVQFSPVLLSPILFLLTISTNAFDWQPGNNGQVKWSLNCDFYGNDIGSESSRGEDCGGICINNPQCTHFTYSNGVCYLKNNPNSPTAVDSNGAVCGWVERGELRYLSFYQYNNRLLKSIVFRRQPRF